MYQTSTSFRFWTYNEQDLFELRNHRHSEFIRVHGAHLDVTIKIYRDKLWCRLKHRVKLKTKRKIRIIFKLLNDIIY